jgi:multicomponent Na+:H+ antiporter subunit C
MIAVLAVAVALLVTAGVHLLLERSLFRAVLGLSLLANAANLIVLSSGGVGEVSPILGRPTDGGVVADPLPQAMVLTAIVISMALTLYLLALLRTTSEQTGSTVAQAPHSGDGERDPAAIARELGDGEAVQ